MKDTKISLVLLTSALAVMTSGITMQSAHPAPPGGNNSSFKIYTNDLSGIRLQYPSDWTPSSIGLKDYTDIIAFYSPLQNISDSFPTRLKISLNRFSQVPTLADYTNHVLGQIKRANGTIVSNDANITLSGHPAHRVVWIESPLTNSPFKFYGLKIWTIVGNNSYLITYEGEQSRFNQRFHEVGQIIDSLRIP